MTFEKAKLFWKVDSDVRKIHCISYDDNTEYYTFLRKCNEDGYKQVIISSEIMIQLIREACLGKGYKITKIEFVEEDAELEEEIQVILQLMGENSAYFSDLVDKLKFLAERSSIDIKRVYIKGSYTQDYSDFYFLQSNGIIGINKESYSTIAPDISTSIERYLIK